MAAAADTSPHAERLQIELWPRMSPLEKLHLVNDLTVATRELCLAGIHLRHPRATETEVRLRLAFIVLDRDLAVRAYPEAARLDA